MGFNSLLYNQQKYKEDKHITLLQLITNCVNFVTQDDEEVNELNIVEFEESSNYKSFLKNALPEINRAIQEISQYEKLPCQVIEIDNREKGTSKNKEILLNELDPEIKYNSKIKRIFKIEVESDDGCYYSPIEYRYYKSLGKIIMPNISGIIRIIYYPFIRLLTEIDKGTYKHSDKGYNEVDDSLDLSTLGLNDTICDLVIPYLVKATLWQEIEPELAQLERNKGLQILSTINNGDDGMNYQESVATTNFYDNW